MTDGSEGRDSTSARDSKFFDSKIDVNSASVGLHKVIWWLCSSIVSSASFSVSSKVVSVSSISGSKVPKIL